MDEKQGFVFLPSYYEAIRELPPEVRLEVYDAICQYGLDGEWPEALHGIARTVLLLIRPTLDRGQRKYKASVENGKKGGNPNFQKGRRNPYYPEDNPEDNPKDNPEDNPGDNQDKDIDKDKEKDKDKEEEREEEKEKDTETAQGAGDYENVFLSSDQWERLKKNFPDTWLWHVNRLSGMIQAGRSLPRRGHCDAIFALAEQDILNGHTQWGRGP